ncbi:hypothetical protein B5C26_21880 [Photorhabdus luminescens]|uniref:Cyclodipeptide synthase n=1 Tax=Photorhabdus luminescens subsp. mexicana TaxID=2100167 RepID=A0A4R4IJU3_PHOLU|nr:hypothetical protein B5C26_21880 [Photorhabdus luminescens]TDB40696.1 tRNA-dependent cyclodipeptide synthase [Photorhabdus luminescens subsp. mexicana]
MIQRGDHALVGISPFNSRFSKDYVMDLIQWSSHYFRQVDILCCDITRNTVTYTVQRHNSEYVAILEKHQTRMKYSRRSI